MKRFVSAASCGLSSAALALVLASFSRNGIAIHKTSSICSDGERRIESWTNDESTLQIIVGPASIGSRR
jgi:hypothetical protein